MKNLIAALLFMTISNACSNNSDSLSILKVLEITDTTYSNNQDSLSSIKKNNVEISDTTFKCTVITNSKNKYQGVHIFGLNDSSVKILAGKFTGEILINDIRSIKFNGRGFWRGALIGSGAAFLLGFLPYLILNDTAESSEENNNNLILAGIGVGTALAIPFALIGGIIGQKDKEYDLRKLDYEAKRKKVKDLIKEYSNR